MPRPTSYKSAHAKAKKALSEYIKLRDCLRTTGMPDYCVCITCKRQKHWDETDPGHFMKATNRTIEFHVDNVWGQCTHCNRFMDGRQYDMGKELEKLLGEERVAWLRNQGGGQGPRHTIEELEQITKDFKEMTNELAANQK